VGKGVLLELDGRQAVILTPQGEFKRVPAPRGPWDIGDEIEFAEVRHTPWAKWGLVAAAAVVFLLAPAGYQAYSLAQPVAIVTVDINPSIQLTLNKADQVLKADGLNPDGEVVLQGMAFRRQPVGDVVAAITARAVDAQKLNVADESGVVVVGIAPAKEKDLAKVHADRIRDEAYSAVAGQVAQKAKEQGVAAKATVAAVEATAAEKAEADELGLPVGKLIIYKTYEAARQTQPDKLPEVTTDDFRDMGPGKLFKSVGVVPSEIFGQAEKDHEGKTNNGHGQGGQETQPAQPVSGQPANTAKPDDKSQGKSDDTQPKENNGQSKGDDKKSDEKGSPPGQSKDDQGKQGRSNDSKSNGADEQPGSSKGDGNSGKEKKDDQSKGNEKKGSESGDGRDTWNLFGWTIEKPVFLRGQSNVTEPTAPEQNSPRAAAPGAGASDSVKPESPPPQPAKSGDAQPSGESSRPSEQVREQPKQEADKQHEEEKQQAEREREQKKTEGQQEKSKEKENGKN
jgi:hypothetical protein